VQSTIFTIDKRHILVLFSQLVPNITFPQPSQHHVPTHCTVHNSSVSTFLTSNCSLQCLMKCADVNLNVYTIISSTVKLRDTICALWNTLNLTSLCPICLPAIQVSIPHVTAYVDVTQLNCLSNITFLFHNHFDVSKGFLQKSTDPQVAENFCMLCTPRFHCGGHKTTRLVNNLTEPYGSNLHSSIIFL
jgi:hypothetical protein